MLSSTSGHQDAGRLSSLRQVVLEDTFAQAALGRLTRLAAKLLDAPAALVALVDGSHQVFRGAVGLPESLLSRWDQSDSFFRQAVQGRRPLIVGDALGHAQVRDSPLVTRLGAAAYAGYPLVTSDGYTVGVLCVVDTKRRDWGVREHEGLKDLSDQVVAELELRAATAPQKPALLPRKNPMADVKAMLLDAASDGISGMDANGRCIYINRAGARMLGYEPEEMVGKQMHPLIHHSRIDGTVYPQSQCPMEKSIREAQRCRVEHDVFWRKDKKPVHVEYSTTPFFIGGDIGGAVVAFYDISERRRRDAVRRKVSKMIVDDLRQPVHTIMSDIQQLRPTATSRQRDLMEQVSQTAKDMLARLNMADPSSTAGEMRLDIDSDEHRYYDPTAL